MIAAMPILAAMTPCPVVRIDYWGSEHLTESYFVARVEPMPVGPLTYRWSVDKGQLHLGASPEHASVTVDLGALMTGDVGYTLTLEVGGLPAGCPHKVTRAHVEPRFEGMPEPASRPR